MNEQPPWWAIPLLSGFLALAGVFVGQVLTTRSETRRAKREDQQRWHQLRLDLYFNFRETAWQLRETISSFRQGKRESLSIHDVSSTHQLLNRIGLISTPMVHDAALDLYVNLFATLLETMEIYANWTDGAKSLEDNTTATISSIGNETDPEWDTSDLDKSVSQSFVSFSTAVRAELGVPLPWLPTENVTRLQHWIGKRRSKRRHPSRAKRR
jgi:hypothetical protein